MLKPLCITTACYEYFLIFLALKLCVLNSCLSVIYQINSTKLHQLVRINSSRHQKMEYCNYRWDAMPDLTYRTLLIFIQCIRNVSLNLVFVWSLKFDLVQVLYSIFILSAIDFLEQNKQPSILRKMVWVYLQPSSNLQSQSYR